jgi:hypothetical protein
MKHELMKLMKHETWKHEAMKHERNGMFMKHGNMNMETWAYEAWYET